MSTGSTPTHLETALRPFLPGLASDEPLVADAPLSRHGLDSFGMVQLVLALERQYGIALPDEVLDEGNFATAAAMWRMLESLGAVAPETGVAVL